jgi:hypothetical protein
MNSEKSLSDDDTGYDSNEYFEHYSLYDCYSNIMDDNNITMSENPGNVEYTLHEFVPEDVPKYSSKVPSIIFIIPYRDRQEHLESYLAQMKIVLPATDSYNPDDVKICIVHQCDNRSFNRGALKNIGFIVTKNKYPNDYQNITLVFNDVDTYPVAAGIIPSYDTARGIVKHFYGFTYALGGIVSVKAGDFEAMNGFPNYWTWGFEDNMLQKRAIKAGFGIDRSNFFPANHSNISHHASGNERIINRSEFERYAQNRNDGINTITNVTYDTYEKDDQIGFINVNTFDTEYHHNQSLDQRYDIRSNRAPFSIGYSTKRNAKIGMSIM